MNFRDLKKQYEILKEDIDQAVIDVMSSSKYINGPDVKELERELAEYVGVKHCITCGNGTDAITLALMAWDIRPGDAIFVPDFTFFASGECPALVGGTPVFVDVDKDTFNIDPVKLEDAINRVIEDGQYRPKAVVAVDLFGLPADYNNIKKICNKYNLLLLEDGAQGFGGSIDGKITCSFGDISTTSFFPAKPLGCYGDGGAVFTDNDEWAELIRSYAVHGKGSMKYDNVRIGMNSRLDSIQAAILRVKLKAFLNYELEDVNKAADCYNLFLKDTEFELPVVPEKYMSSWAQYTIKVPDDIDRSKLQDVLKNKDIPTMVYYPKPMHRQKAFQNNDSIAVDNSVTEKLCSRVLSLPMHPYLKKEDIKRIATILKECI